MPQKDGFCFPILSVHSANLCLLLGELSPLKLRGTNDHWLFFPVITYVSLLWILLCEII